MAKVIKICWVRISVLKEVQLYRKRQITNDIIHTILVCITNAFCAPLQLS